MCASREQGRSRRALTSLLAGLVVVSVFVTSCGKSGNTADEAGKANFRRPVDMIAPFGAGGGADQVARAVASAMEPELGVDVPVVNVEGATGSTGMTKMLASRPGDAMAILIQDTLATVPAGSASFSMDEVRAVCRLQSMPSALFVRKGAYDDWQDLAADAKSKPGELKVGTVGRDSVDDIALAALAKEHGTKFRAVPYSTPNERYASLLGGS
ncbi:MAG: tripartite tricarboxylate transporter substrate binding protein, partial [Actinophytocola sp.]|nr:tripartite tricarboxylate transporter substrate binding protein [Actinophytocola sp.]